MNLPKYEKLRQYVLDMIFRHMDSDTPIMSEREMCRTFGVTRTTVHQAIKTLIQEEVLIPKQGSGLYVNTQAYRNSFTRFDDVHKILFLASRGHASFFDSWYSNIISKVCAEISRTNSCINLCSLTGEPGSEFEEIMMYRPDGILWLRPDEKCRGVLEKIRKSLPVCSLLNAPENDQFSVTVDFFKSGVIAAEWFIGRGMKKVAYIGASSRYFKSREIDLFLDGWKSAWRQKYGPKHKIPVLRQDEDFRTFFNSKSAAGLDGIFCHSHVFGAVAADIHGTPFEACPVMVDSDNYRQPANISCTPAAEIVLYPDTVFSAAVENLIKSVEDDSFKQEEILIETKIKILTAAKGTKHE